MTLHQELHANKDSQNGGFPVKVFVLLLGFLCPVMTPLPVLAGTLYDNGPPNGGVDAWTINGGYVVSDSFVLSSEANITGLSFWTWMLPGDTLTSAEVSITSNEFGGVTFFDDTVSFSQSDCVANGAGYYVCNEVGNFNVPDLQAGDYWLNLQNASVPSGDPVYWDENSGPSQASVNGIGTIPSEAFEILGNRTSGTTPEPGTLLLFSTGLVALARKLHRTLP